MIAYETSAALDAVNGIRHGFFGRQGGVSTGEFASLNVSLSVGDDAGVVEHNRQCIESEIGIGPLVILKQTHSTRIETVTAPIEAGTVDADALVTSVPGLALAILTADCTPILLADPQAGVIGAAHAGWRGAVDGIVENTVVAMVALGAKRKNIVAALGPTIYAPSYEVGDKFRDDFLQLHPAGDHHFHIPVGGKVHFDLPGFVIEQLGAAEIAMVDRVGECTYAHPDRYFSHRYATHQGTRTGRQIAVIGMT